MKILYILGAYKPNMSANGICSDNVINNLIENGHEVTALVNADEDCPEYSNEGLLTIVRVKQRLFLRLTGKASACEKVNPKKSALLRLFARIINKIQLIFATPIWPIVSPITVHRFSKKALMLQEKQKFDVVVSVYTPVESLLAGYSVKKKYPEVKYVPYFLDALAGGWGPKKWNEKKKEKHTRRIESKIAEYSDLIISMKSSKNYHLKHPLFPGKTVNRYYLDVPTLVPRKIKQTYNTAEDAHVLLYTGYINYPHRNPIPLLKILSRLCSISNTKVIFAGTCSKPEIFDSYINATNGAISYLGQQTHDKIFELGKHADFFLNIGSTNPNTIACKIFEYMVYSKPIISTYSINNEPSIPSLKKYGHYFLIDERNKNIELIAQKLKFYIENNDRSTAGYKDVKTIFYDNTPQAFTECIENLMESSQ